MAFDYSCKIILDLLISIRIRPRFPPISFSSNYIVGIYSTCGQWTTLNRNCIEIQNMSFGPLSSARSKPINRFQSELWHFINLADLNLRFGFQTNSIIVDRTFYYIFILLYEYYNIIEAVFYEEIKIHKHT